MEDSGEGEEIGEQSDITAGQSESTEDSEEQGVGRAEAPNNQGHHGESRQNTVQAPSDTNQQVSVERLRHISFLLVQLRLKIYFGTL